MAEKQGVTTGLVSGVSGRYANALFELVQADKSRKNLVNQVQTLRAALKPDMASELVQFLQNPGLEKARKQAVLVAVAEELKLGKLLTNFLRLVTEKGRAPVLPQILADFQRLQDAADGVVKVHVQSATKLNKTQEKEIEKFVKENAALGCGAVKKVDMNVTLDKSLVAGVRIRAGDTVFDNSVHGRMEALKTSLRQHAQSDA